MKLISLFAGIGGFDLGLERAGFTPAGVCEIDPQARAVLARHWPSVPQHDDVTTLAVDTFGAADVITFGSPCQDLSVAGQRAGLAGERSSLFVDAMRYIRAMIGETDVYPRFAVWENVPGALFSNGGRDFAAVLALMVGGEVRHPANGWPTAGVAFGELGSAEWRVLNSEYFGVAQRRRRLFVVYRPRGESAGEILLEPEPLPRPDRARAQERPPHPRAAAVDPRGPGAAMSEPMPFDQARLPRPTWRTSIQPGRPAPTLTASGSMCVAFAPRAYTAGRGMRMSPLAGALTTRANSDMSTHLLEAGKVRRLTPRESERLQGFPDDWTRYDPHGREISDSARYRMLGNAVPVPVIEWIGRRLRPAMIAAERQAVAA